MKKINTKNKFIKIIDFFLNKSENIIEHDFGDNPSLFIVKITKIDNFFVLCESIDEHNTIILELFCPSIFQNLNIEFKILINENNGSFIMEFLYGIKNSKNNILITEEDLVKHKININPILENIKNLKEKLRKELSKNNEIIEANVIELI